jgi:S1-C subfamily serine protease
MLGSVAAKANLKPCDPLLTIDNRWTDTLADLYKIAGHIKSGIIVPVSIQHGGKEKELKVKPRAGL